MKGFRDFYPEEKRVQNYIFSVWKNTAEKYGFDEIAGPVLEPVELYQKSGSEIPEQMYTFTDKSGRKIALRPELTPTIARMVKQKILQKPIKWYSIPECFRYEAPQTGRARSFSQLNLDILGSNSMKSDAEIILCAIDIMRNFNLTKKDFFIRISNRKLFEDLLFSIGITKTQLKEVSKIIDKQNKISKADFIDLLKKQNLSDKQIKDLNVILKIKDLKKIKIESKGLNELKELLSYLKSYNVLDFCKLDLGIVRGFDYYTSTVFEVFDAKKEFRAIAGGGRYDELAPGCPGIGFGMGDVVLELFLNKRNKLKVSNKIIDYYIAPVNDKVYDKAIKIANKLRNNGFMVEIDLMNRNLGKQFNYANSRGVKNTVIVGEKDKGKVTVKDMKTGKEKKISM